jgi:hypothetical protein
VEVKPDVPAEIPVTFTIGSRLPAHLLVDGKDEGNAVVFRLSLVPGPHDIVVQHQCCEEYRKVVQVVTNRELYPLNVGDPKPGHVRVLNADPDTPVYLIEDESGNEMPLGTAKDVSRIDILMRRPTEERKFNVGGKVRRKVLEAGRTVTIDAMDGQ